jgi:hypothetical protein
VLLASRKSWPTRQRFPSIFQSGPGGRFFVGVFFDAWRFRGITGYGIFRARRPARSRYTPGVPNASHFGGTPRSSWPFSSTIPTIHYLCYRLAPKPSAVCLNLPSCSRAPAGSPRSVANRKSAVSLPLSARTCDGRFSRTADSYPGYYRLLASPVVSWESGCILRRTSAPKKGARQGFSWLATDRGHPAGARRSDVKFRHSPNGLGATQKK